MKQIDLIIFDCDGVLIDSELISCECAMTALRAVGLQIDLETVIRRFLGTSRREMARQVAEAGFPVSEDFPERLEAAVAEAFKTRLHGMTGVQQALSELDVPCCVASNSPLSYIRQGLELTGLSHFFGSHLFSASMVKRGKPAPDLFLYAAGQMGAAPEHCLVIEDSVIGVRAANEAGMPVFWFLGGSHIDLVRRPPELHLAPSAEQFVRMDQLGGLIRKLRRT